MFTLNPSVNSFVSVTSTQGKSGFRINFTNSDTFSFNAFSVGRFPILIKQNSDIRQTSFSVFFYRPQKFPSISVVQVWLLSFPWNIFHTSLIPKAINHGCNCTTWYFFDRYRVTTTSFTSLLTSSLGAAKLFSGRYEEVDKLYDVCICHRIAT